MPPLAKEQILRAIREAVGGEGLVAVAYLMGSYADGTATHLSDVDVGVGIYPRPGIDAAEAAWLAADIEHRVTQELFPDYEADCCPEWLFDPVEVVVLNAPGTLPSLPWMLACAVPAHAPDPAFQAALEELAFARGRPSGRQARRAAWRLKARWIVRAALGKTFATYEGLLRTCLNLAHRAVVELRLNVPARRQDLPAALAEAGVVSPRTARFVAEAVEMLSGENVPLRIWGNLRRNMRLLAEYALDVEEALERVVPVDA
ncbi:MAG: nucleotidyltransferase domain-containing protein [Clostridia bacterium]|nr:nucleotidyltransferase domain-containing protein [Clostridia bacterium]